MGKIGRNDPCPCGSGKKYKKCCLSKDRKREQECLSSVSMDFVVDWILNEPKLKYTFDLLLKKYIKDEVANEIQFSQLLDAFIFDYTLPKVNITPFKYFLENAGFSPKLYHIYERFDKNVFSIFKVIDVQYNRGMMLQDMIYDERFWINEKKGTHSVNLGDAVFCRIAPFQDGFISLSPAVNRWPAEASYMIERGFRGFHAHGEEKPMNAFDLFEILYNSEDKPKDLPEIKKALKKKLNKIGLKIDFRSLDKRINENTRLYDAFPEILEFHFPSNKDFREIMNLFQMLLNTYPRHEFKGTTPAQTCKIGPKENMLIQDFMDEVMKNINPDTYPSPKEAEAAAKKFQRKWLKTPQKELDGKTPIEVIIKEREMLGNPNKKFDIQMEITGIRDYDVNLAEKLYFEGVDALNEGAVGLAAERFDQVTKMYPENYKAWANLGNSLAYLGAKKEAIKCYKKALAINSEYAFAQKNLESIKNIPEKILLMRGVAGALKGAVHYGIGSKRKKNVEKINVWEEVDKAINEERKKKEDR